jgi:hypothetical protein
VLGLRRDRLSLGVAVFGYLGMLVIVISEYVERRLDDRRRG